MFIEHVQHILPVLHQNGHPHIGIAFREPHRTFKTRTRHFKNGPVFPLFLQHRICECKGSDVRDMTHIGRMQIMIVGIHFNQVHANLAKHVPRPLHRVCIRRLGIADHHGLVLKGSPHRRGRTTILRTPHWVCRHIAFSFRVSVYVSNQCGFC